MILVDTSAWVEYLRGTDSRFARRVLELVRTDAAVATTEPVVMEIVAGATSDEREHDLRRLLTRFELLPFHPVIDFDGAAALYRRSRKQGITPRGLIDCMIASVALRHGAVILTSDRDLHRLATVAGIGLDLR